MKKGNIIFLFGVSSAGKSTLAKALQNKLSIPYFHLSKDLFMCDMAPVNFPNSIWTSKYSACSSLFYHTIKLFSDMGMNVIADSVRLDAEYARLLSDCRVIYVHVICDSIEELWRREKARGDRDIGQAEKQLQEICPNSMYNMTVDTSRYTTDECADLVCSNLIGKWS